MNTAEGLFLEAWRFGVTLSANGNKLHYESPAKPPDELLEKLKNRKPEMLRFLSCWIDTPHGEGKVWGLVGGDRCGVVLRSQPDRVIFVKCSELRIKPKEEDALATMQ